MRAYFGSRISEHMARTPEGYLICKDVPIARTGIQQYRGMEFGGEDPNKLYNVERPEAEVFSKVALASFEGKPVVDEHPHEDVKTGNVLRYLKGTCRNVHRGDGALSDCIVADLIIYDDDLIRKIEDGKRDISCGYDCLWEPKDDATYIQREIRGNHVAVVDRGRAGHKVSIRDSKGGMKKMSYKGKKQGLWGRMLAAFARDEDTSPEDLAAAAKLNPETQDGDPAPVPTPATAPQQGQGEKPAFDADEMNERLNRIEDALQAIVNKGAEPKEPTPAPQQKEPNALDDLEQHLRGQDPHPDVKDEDGVDVPPQQINAANGEANDDDDGIIEPGEGNSDDPQAVRDAALSIIDGLKPVIANLPPNQRRAAADSMAALLRGNIQAVDNQYGVLANAQRNGHSVRDSNPIMDDEAYGKLIRDKYNPHYKK
ncbi:MAG TPA: hypothetical protein DDY92_01910 [Dialister sp.]|nr:hypothetical protein [Dialister sp.]